MMEFMQVGKEMLIVLSFFAVIVAFMVLIAGWLR